MIDAVLLLGGNMGDMPRNLDKARMEISKRLGKITDMSKEYKSEAWGFSGDEFLNQALVCNTELTPIELLNQIWEIEKLFGRDRGSEAEELAKYNDRKLGLVEYSPRAMDIDILYYGNEEINTPLLTIPHPLISEREFVLRPLADLRRK